MAISDLLVIVLTVGACYVLVRWLRGPKPVQKQDSTTPSEAVQAQTAPVVKSSVVDAVHGSSEDKST